MISASTEMDCRAGAVPAIKEVTTLLLAGGLGSRLRPVVGNKPKAMAPVLGRPFLEFMLLYVRRWVLDVVICTGFGGDVIVQHLGDGSRWGLRLRYSHEASPLGTGGAIKLAQPLIASDPFLVLNGDTFTDADLGALFNFHLEKGASISMLLVQGSGDRFEATLTDESGQVIEFRQRSERSNELVNAGVYLMRKEVLDTIPSGCPFSLEQDLFPRYAGRGLYGMLHQGLFIDIGTPESYAQADRVLREATHVFLD